ncbi:3-hydroxyisobutyryl-CoA hydrolase, mitochondrial-like isoform X1 [Chrysoperla carnea]|uniref:3-hydroxyisobutyryl-CoA hydrolase, mitochondrial-like isoform X1 n=2 Tax=Chrysoperla carnea TaxID=189513 RepID=UPI001D084306|nr:3-hydroxyisobutyryl-CoA hydrolase, mitochondrial-like isoform X1 [Chrysoperla carnea]
MASTLKYLTKPGRILIHPSSSPLRVVCRNMCQSHEDVILESTKTVGVMMLNRPQYLNALNLSMVNKILAALNDWQETKAVVIMRALGQRAFCAGGDVKKVAEAAYIGDYNYGDEFFYREYKMNNLIGNLKIPYVTFMDGITMGGGVGLAIHSNYRVATENTLFAMPECRIGFFPDVGSSYVLPRMTGYLGLYLGLTGQRLKGPCVYHAGIATHYVESKNLHKLEQELLLCSGHKDVKDTLDCFHKQTDEGKFILKPHLGMIDAVFCENEVEMIMTKLNMYREDSEWVQCVMKTLYDQCPTSLKVTTKAFYKGMTMNLDQCLNMELQMAKYAIRQPDFYEGIRAQLISKDNNPKFSPATIPEVTDEMVDAFFEDCTCTKYGKI